MSNFIVIEHESFGTHTVSVQGLAPDRELNQLQALASVYPDDATWFVTEAPSIRDVKFPGEP